MMIFCKAALNQCIQWKCSADHMYSTWVLLVKIISKLVQTSHCGQNLSAETRLYNTDLSETHTHTHTPARHDDAELWSICVSRGLQHFSYCYLHTDSIGNPKYKL